MPSQPKSDARRKPALISRAVQRVIVSLFSARGWRIEGGIPSNVKKCVIAASPHSTNWDFVTFAGAAERVGIQPSFMGKKSLFDGWMGSFMYDMDGVPIDRTRRANVVDQVAREFERRDELALVIAVEGSRSSTGEWRSGFYNIAMKAGVPIVPAYADNERRVVGFAEPLMPSGDYGSDLLAIASWLRSRLPTLDRYEVLEAQARALVAMKDTAGRSPL